MTTQDLQLQNKEEKNIYYNHLLRDNILHLKKTLQNDYDSFGIITGRERRGKSTLAGQIAKLVDPTYNLSRCCFTAEQFVEAVENGTNGQAIIFDEAYGYLNSRQALSKFNRILVKVMTEMGSRNLFVLIVLPNFFELDKYPAIHRSDFLVHVHKRGQFVFFNYKKKKLLYLRGKKFYTYGAVKGNFNGSFYKGLPYDEKEYELKKRSALSDYNNSQIQKDEKWKTRTYILATYLNKVIGHTQAQIGQLLQCSQQNVGHMLGNELNNDQKDEIIFNTLNKGQLTDNGSEKEEEND